VGRPECCDGYRGLLEGFDVNDCLSYVILGKKKVWEMKRHKSFQFHQDGREVR
jgi:hypothetical protein